MANVKEIQGINDGSITVAMDLPDGIEIAKVKMPCLLSVEKDIFMPRLPSYIKKTASKDRPITILSLKDMEDKEADHYGLNGSPTQVIRIFPPNNEKEKEMWNGSGQVLSDRLLEKLHELKFI